MVEVKPDLNYTLIDHTADLAVIVSGSDLGDLFRTAGLTLIALITDTHRLTAAKTEKICVEGDDIDDLMANWLREILYYWAGRELLVQDIDIDSASLNEIKARLAVDAFDPERHVIVNEIKAVTYHDLEVKKTQGGYEAKIIFDV